MALAVAAIHAPRAFLDLPLYSSDEGAYLVRALYGDLLRADPQHAPFVANVDNVVFFWVVRLFGLLPEPLGLDALRVGGGLAYVGGLVLAWRAVAPRLQQGEAIGLLLLALIYPYYRFVFTALPEGWYVGVLGGMILVTARLWRPRPMLHAVAFGALGAVLVLIKPHGVAVMCAGPALVLADLVLQRGKGLATAALRVAVVGAAFLAAGHLLRVLESPGLPHQIAFFGQGFYTQVLDKAPGAEADHVAMSALYAMTMSSMLLAGPAIALALDDLLRRARHKAFRPEGPDLAFLLTFAAFAATVCMVTVFAFKATALGEGEMYRLWGRYFEFFIPLLWLTAWPAIRRVEALPDRRLLAAGACFAGLVGLTIALKEAVVLLPWDAGALHAFFQPTARYAGSSFPSYALAAAAMLGAMILMLRRAPILPVWQGAFFALALLAAGQDGAWMSALLPERRLLAADVAKVRETLKPADRVIAYVDDANLHQNLLVGLKGRPRMVMIAPGIAVQPHAGYDYVLVQSGHSLEGRGWRLVQRGQRFSVFAPKS
jgi:hypothetical protein